MAFPNDVLQTPGGNVALQTVSLLFNAASLGLGALRPAFKPIIGAPSNGSVLDSITIDVTLSEVHTANSEVTAHPVEQGADITDHVRPKPVELRMEGLISDTPLDDSLVNAAARAVPGLGLGLATAASLQTLLSGATSISNAAFDRFRQFRDTGTPLTIYTPYRTYSNMVMDSLIITRDQATGEALKFTCTFREVLLVSSGVATVTLPAVAQNAKDMGTQGVATASDKLKKNVSGLYSGINTATGGGLDAFKKWEGQ